MFVVPKPTMMIVGMKDCDVVGFVFLPFMLGSGEQPTIEVSTAAPTANFNQLPCFIVVSLTINLSLA